MAQSLPSHRQFLTSLVASLSQSPPPPPPQAKPTGSDVVSAGSADAERRRLLLTLHVLFPSIVLPALDLLDRGLVTRITVAGERAAAPRVHGRDGGEGAAEGDGDDGTGTDRPMSPPRRTGHDETPWAGVYILRSLTSAATRRSGRAAASASRTYVVYLDAWSCSCAGFALEAFAPRPQSAVHADTLAQPSTRAPERDLALRWSAFGGMSADGFQEEDVPCCKHLLACLLAERWGGMLGSRVDDKRVTKEELAGIISNV